MRETEKQLRERVKELNCLYTISRLTQAPNVSIDAIIQGVLNILPDSMQYPEIASCRIVVDGTEYHSDGFNAGGWVLDSDFHFSGRRAGVIEVHYADKQLSSDENPFLEEEQHLIDAVAQQIEEIVERLRVQEALKREHALFISVVDTIDEAIIICDEHGAIVRFNEAARRLHGLPEAPVSPDEWSQYYSLYTSDGTELLPKEEIPLVRALNGEVVHDARITVRPTGRGAHLLSVNGSQLTDSTGKSTGAVVALHDITELKLSEERASALAQEREMLLKEVQHRVKNTMGMMVSILTLEAQNVEDSPIAVGALTNAINRFHSMQVLYDQLYRTDSHQSSSLREYLQKLVRTIVNGSASGVAVQLTTNMDEVILDAKRLSEVGFIVNELVTNAMKYAFNDRSSGNLSVSVRNQSGNVSVIVEDDGPGLPDSSSEPDNSSFGMVLIHSYAENLGGTIRFEEDDGLRVVLELPE